MVDIHGIGDQVLPKGSYRQLCIVHEKESYKGPPPTLVDV